MTTPDDRQALLAGGERGSAIPQAMAYGSWSLFDGPGLTVRPRPSQVSHAIDSDGRTSLLEQALTLPLRGAAHHFEAPAGDIGQTAWVEEKLTTAANAGGMSTPLDMILGQMTSAVWRRTVCFEKVWAPVDGGTRVAYDSVALRPDATVMRDLRSGKFQGISQVVPKVVTDSSGSQRVEGTETIRLAPDRSFVYVHGQHRDPLFGVGDLDISWLVTEVKSKIRFLWWKFLENVSFPSATMLTANPPSDAQSLAQAAQRAASLRSGGILPLGTGESLVPYDSNGQGAAQFQAALDWLSSEQAQSVLAGFADLTGPGKTGGSYALSVSATDLFTAGRDSVLTEMADSVSNYLIPDLVRWNYGPGVPSPRLRYTPLKQTDLQQTTDLLKSMARESADSTIPQSFIDELAIKTAGYLELDVEKVRANLTSGHPLGNGPFGLNPRTGQPMNATAVASPTAAPVVQVASQVERARQLVLAHDAVRAA